MISKIRSDHGGEFDNHNFEELCNTYGYEHNFSTRRTPQQNRVVERRNRTLQDMARTMLNEYKLPKYFWAEVVNTACYTLNRVLIRPILKKTPFEIWNDRKPKISYFKVFGCKCFILNTKDNLGKFDAKSDECIFLGYSTSSKAYKVFNKRTNVVEESMHVTFDELDPYLHKVIYDEVDKDLHKVSIYDSHNKINNPLSIENLDETPHSDLPKAWKYQASYPSDQIIGDPSHGTKTRSSLRNICEHLAFISQIEPKSIDDAICDEH